MGKTFFFVGKTIGKSRGKLPEIEKKLLEIEKKLLEMEKKLPEIERF